MLINPQTTFELLKDVPFDSNYGHTILFPAIGSQLNYMTSKVSHSYLNFSYVRHSENGISSVKVPETADNIYDCSYCRFFNAGFGQKWFYGFIKSIEYINNNTARVDFVVDMWQTWMFDFTIGTCYVEREHVTNDAIGNHTLEENIPFGEYISDGEILEKDLGSGVIVQLALSGSEYGVEAGVFTGLTVAGAEITGVGSIGDLLNQLSDTPEKIAMLTMCSGGMVENKTVQIKTSGVGINRQTNGFSFNGVKYSPKNNKLYCYPYCLLSLDNYNGNSENYRWEDFNDPTMASFTIHESPLPRPSIECYPLNYKGMVSAQNFGVSYDNFPMCPYTIDTYRAWSSQAVPKQLISTGTTIAAAVFTGGTVGAALGLKAGTDIANMSIDNEYKKIHGSSYGGSVAGSGMNFAFNRIGFRLIRYTIKPEYAMIVDSYFTRFGYRVDTYKVPETKNRASFNYVKTVESNVHGNIPQQAIDTIEKSLNRGITLWHTTDVKNYSLSNEVINEQEKQ